MNNEVKRRRDKRIRELGGYTAEDIRKARAYENRAIRCNDLNVQTFGVKRIIDASCPTSMIDVERTMKMQLIDEIITNYPQAIKTVWTEMNPGQMVLGVKVKMVMWEE